MKTIWQVMGTEVADVYSAERHSIAHFTSQESAERLRSRDEALVAVGHNQYTYILVRCVPLFENLEEFLDYDDEQVRQRTLQGLSSRQKRLIGVE